MAIDLTDYPLASRSGLPDALRILLAEFPKEAWNPPDGGLIRFWLDRHLMFRRLLKAMNEDVQHYIDKNIENQIFAGRLSRYGSMFVGELHAHHNIEDHHYFPKLVRLDHRIEAGFELLEGDHHAIDPMLEEFTNAANDILSSVKDRRQEVFDIRVLGRCLETFDRLLDRHLTDEEELIVPLLLKYEPEGLI